MSSEQDQQTSREWLRLHAAQLAIRGQIEDAGDAEQRRVLLEEFARNRDAIAEIERTEGKQPGPSPSEASEEDPVATAEGIPQHTGEHADGGVAVDDLFASLGLNDGRPEPVTTVPPVGAPTEDSGSRLWPAALAGALGIALLLGIGGAIWLRGSDNGTETAAEGGGDVSTTNAPPDVSAQAEELNMTLERLGFNMVEVEVRGDVVHLSGVVPTEQDLSTIRSAAISSLDADSLNMSDVEVMAGGYNNDETAAPAPGEAPPGRPTPGRPAPGAPGAAPPPGSPPPGFVPPTVEQQENLQKELNRVLAKTPLVFEPGSTSLNDLQLTVLESTVIGLLEAHPGVPVRLVGYTDESGGEFENSLLSFARANAVRDYLISRGVPEFILRAEGRGEDDASGEAGADRRVEIEVITGPGGP